MVWNRNSDHIQDMWFFKRKECKGCAPSPSGRRTCPKGHSKQHYFGGSVAHWRAQESMSPSHRPVPWQRNNHQPDPNRGGKGKGGQGKGEGQGKNRESAEMAAMRKELQAANAQIKRNALADDQPDDMAVDQEAKEPKEPAQPNRKQEDAERNKRRSILQKKLHSLQYHLKWAQEQSMPDTQATQTAIAETNQAITKIAQEDLSSKSPMEQMQRAQKSARLAKEALAAEREWGTTLQSQADAIVAQQATNQEATLKLKDKSDQEDAKLQAASVIYQTSLQCQTNAAEAAPAGVAGEANTTSHDPALLSKFGISSDSIKQLDLYTAERNKLIAEKNRSPLETEQPLAPTAEMLRVQQQLSDLQNQLQQKSDQNIQLQQQQEEFMASLDEAQTATWQTFSGKSGKKDAKEVQGPYGGKDTGGKGTASKGD